MWQETEQARGTRGWRTQCMAKAQRLDFLQIRHCKGPSAVICTDFVRASHLFSLTVIDWDEEPASHLHTRSVLNELLWEYGA